jgi:frataxin
MDDTAFQSVADATLTDLMDWIEADFGDHMDVDLENGILTIELDDGAQYLINKHGPMRQIWLSSPVSGAGHYDYDTAQGAWINSRSGDNLAALLSAELNAAAG